MARFNLASIRFSISGAKFDLPSFGLNSSGIKTLWKKPTQSTGPSQTDATWDGAGGLAEIPPKIVPLQEQMRRFQGEESAQNRAGKGSAGEVNSSDSMETQKGTHGTTSDRRHRESGALVFGGWRRGGGWVPELDPHVISSSSVPPLITLILFFSLSEVWAC